MRRRLLELLLYLAAPIALFITSPLLAQGLGTSARGHLGLIQSIASFAAAVGALGQAEVVLDDLRRKRANLITSSRIAFVGAVLACSIGLIVSISLGLHPAVAIIGLVLVPVINQGHIWRAICVANTQLWRPASANAVAAAARTTAIVVLSALGWLTAASAIGAIQGALALGTTLCMYSFARRWQRGREAEPNPHTVGTHILKGSPIIVFTILNSTTYRADMLFLSFMSNAHELGIYAAAAALSMGVLSISGAFKSRAQAAAFRTAPKPAVAREVMILIALALPASTLAWALSPQIVALLLGSGYESAVPVIRVLAFGSLSLMLLDITHGLLVALGARRLLVVVAAIGATTTVVSLTLLVPGGGALGAAWASLISYSLAAATGLLIIFGILLRPLKPIGDRDHARLTDA